MLISEIYDTKTKIPLRLDTIKTKLNNITNYTMLKYETTQEIINILNIFDFELNVSTILINKNIKLTHKRY